MASPQAILRAARAVPGGARPTPPPQGAPGWTGSISPLARELAAADGYASAYGPFLPRPPQDFTSGAFGPFSPILPVPVDAPRDNGRAAPRREQYEVGWDLPVGQPGTEGIGKLATFQTLRAIADLYSVARSAIQLRKNEVKGIGWDIVPTSDAAKAMRGSPSQMKDFGQRRAKAKKFFERPDPDYFTWSSWVGDVMEQVLVFDALSLWLAPKRGRGMRKGLLGSDLDSLQLIDGQTIRPLYDLHGAVPRPPAPGYQQYLYGVPRADLTQVITGRDLEEAGLADAQWQAFRGDQLLYLPMEKRRWSPYGFPPVERALLPIMAGLQKQGYALDFFREGTVPAVYISPGDVAMTPNQIRELQDALNAIAGDPAWHHKIIVLPPGSKTEPQRPAQLADQFDEIVMNWVCMSFDVQPMELGISPRVSTTQSPGAANQMAKQSQSSHERKATKPTLEFLAAICDFILQEVCRQEDMRFLFEGLEEDEDELTKTQALTAQINVGLASIDEARTELGRQPWGLPETSDPIWASATGPVPLGQVDVTGKPVAGQRQPDAAHPAGAQPGQPPGQQPPAQGPAAAPPPAGHGKPAAGREQGNAGQSPGHDAAEAAQDSRERASGHGPGAPASPKAALAELGALARHLRKGRALATWEPRHLAAPVLARVGAGLAAGASPDEAAAMAAALLAKAGAPQGPRRWPGWDLDLDLAAVYARRIAAAFGAAISEAADLIRRWMSGALAATRQGLAGMISAAIERAVGGTLRDLWREAWHLGARSAYAMATATTPDWGTWTPGDVDAAALVSDSAGLQKLLAAHGVSVIKAVASTHMDDLARAIAEAVADGEPAGSLARRLPQVLQVPQRAEMIARTEIARAVSAATMDTYRESGVSRKEWATAPADACPVCAENAKAGPVPLDSAFAGGVLSPPQHPDCRCSLLPAEVHGVDLADDGAFTMAVEPDLVKVGPKGYEHGWVFVGVPGVGDSVFHPHHGRGTVASDDGKHVTVRFEKDGARRSFEATRRDAPGAPRLEPREPVAGHHEPEPAPLPEGVAVTAHPSGTQHVTSPYDKAFIAGLKDMGARWLPKSKAWSVPAGRDSELRDLITRSFGARPDVTPAASLPASVKIRVRPGGKTEVTAPFNDGFRRDARALGGTWDPAAKAWVFPPHRDAQAREAAARHYGDGSDWKRAQDEKRQADAEARGRRPGGEAKASPKQVSFAMRLLAQVGTRDLATWEGAPPSRRDLEQMPASDVSALINDLLATRGW